MQFLVVAHDYTDDGAFQRRLNAREDHLRLCERMKSEGKLLYAAAILSDQDQMVGSMLVVDFFSRGQLDQWLDQEPYVAGKVWDRIDVNLCKVSPGFLRVDF